MNARVTSSVGESCSDAQDAVETVDDLMSLLPIAIDGELSLGYTF